MRVRVCREGRCVRVCEGEGVQGGEGVGGLGSGRGCVRV